MVTWRSATLQADRPAGTAVTLRVRTGSTATPDATWTGWRTVPASGAVGGSSRYLQYQLTLTGSAGATPVVSSVGFTNSGTPVTKPGRRGGETWASAPELAQPPDQVGGAQPEGWRAPTGPGRRRATAPVRRQPVSRQPPSPETSTPRSSNGPDTPAAPLRAMRRWSSIRPARPRASGARAGPHRRAGRPQPRTPAPQARRARSACATSRYRPAGRARHVHQHHVPAAMAGGDHSATTAARHRRDRLNHDPESVAVPVDPDDVEAVQPDQQMTPVAAAGGVGPVAAVRIRARSSDGVGSDSSRPSGRSAWSLPMLGGLDPPQPQLTPACRSAPPPQVRRAHYVAGGRMPVLPAELSERPAGPAEADVRSARVNTR